MFIKFLLLWIFVIFIFAKQSPYEIMGLKRGATQAQVKQAFRKLSLQYHPDKNKSPNAERKYKEITNAYQMILSGQADDIEQQPYYGSYAKDYEDLFNQRFQQNDEYKHFFQNNQNQKQSPGIFESFSTYNFLLFGMIFFVIQYLISQFKPQQQKQPQQEQKKTQEENNHKSNGNQSNYPKQHVQKDFVEKVNKNIQQSYSDSNYDRRAQFYQNLNEQ